MDSTRTGFELRPVTIPVSIDAPDAGDFIRMTRAALVLIDDGSRWPNTTGQANTVSL